MQSRLTPKQKAMQKNVLGVNTSNNIAKDSFMTAEIKQLQHTVPTVTTLQRLNTELHAAQEILLSLPRSNRKAQQALVEHIEV